MMHRTTNIKFCLSLLVINAVNCKDYEASVIDDCYKWDHLWNDTGWGVLVVKRVPMIFYPPQIQFWLIWD